MKNTELLQAIGAVDDRWLLDLDRAMARKVKPRRKLGKTLLLTAAIMALLGATAYAAGFLCHYLLELFARVHCHISFFRVQSYE